MSKAGAWIKAVQTAEAEGKIEGKIESKAVEDLFSPHSIRSNAAELYALALQGKSQFAVDANRLPETASFVLEVIRENYPDLDIPYHSRWRHFTLPGSTQLQTYQAYQAMTSNLEPLEQARVHLDLIIPSVLLDAGAGDSWCYREQDTGLVFNRSEGLAIASLAMFTQGAFSADVNDPLQTDAVRLVNFTEQDIREGFQVGDGNPLAGLTGRAQLIQSLGQVLQHNRDSFPNQRPGDLVDYLLSRHGFTLKATDVFNAVISCFNSIWPGRQRLNGLSLGDVWRCDALGSNRYLPLHKLTQWLCYSIIETLEGAGFSIRNINSLTGLAEYRNGGLFVDSGVLSLKDKRLYQQEHDPASAVIVEWRGLTVHLLDKVAELIRNKLETDATRLPLAKVLEGGTWAAGRKLAAQLRPESSAAPIQIGSDGTVF